MRLKQNGIIVAVWLLLATCSATAGAEDSVDAAMKRLAAIRVFAFGPAGLGGGTSQGELDFRTIAALPQEHALPLFLTLYSIGNTQAKSYALIGIRRISPSKFNEIYRSLSASEEEVTTERGCMVGSEKLSTIARQIQKDPENLKFFRAN
ncbi:hypothetical protein SAMN05421770_10673 [Granulicella rosea]|uniref:Uncharacterized protein n=1 Tax=Granulicella rosea TaxID=474952 RepID=A0A239L4I9_9BACT|nr:hypothetical protein [Granulicella rosea]SNT24828.1 hypothetical protein SAMN05421770_10673 [Granulicella rosea]